MMFEVSGVQLGLGPEDDEFIASASNNNILGGAGFDTLFLDGLRSIGQNIWNLPGHSGGTIGAVDVATGATISVIFKDIESIVGSPFADRLHGNGQITSLYGGDGDDWIMAAMDSPNSSYLRGGDGADTIHGGLTFDDINGNQGDDTAHGWESDDWVVGGQGNDLLFGDTGRDIVYGNLGNDTCDGGPDADIVRGGQGDDSLTGGAGDDWIAGDRGSDTVSGGAGADTFHIFAGAGLDVVLDFSYAEGDRVQLPPGATYIASQVGADTLIELGGDDRMILTGVQLASLGADWIVAV
jgi:serralysin